MILDYVFIGVLEGGVVGAALATGISQLVGGIVPLVYFCVPNKSQLRLVRAKLNMSALWKTCFNGSSELMTNLSISLLNIYGSSFFTALGNGLVSALISFLRTLLFQVIAVLVLPIFFELNGVWFAIVAAEGTALIVTIVFLLHYRKKYGY